MTSNTLKARQRQVEEFCLAEEPGISRFGHFQTEVKNCDSSSEYFTQHCILKNVMMASTNSTQRSASYSPTEIQPLYREFTASGAHKALSEVVFWVLFFFFKQQVEKKVILI